MLVEAADLAILAIRDQSEMPHYATILQARTDVGAHLIPKGTILKANVATRAG